MEGKPSWKDIGGFPLSKQQQEASHNKHVLHCCWVSAENHGETEAAHLTYAKSWRH